jgi:hypothetical protein
MIKKKEKRQKKKTKHLPQDNSPPPSSLFGARCLLPIALLPTAKYSTRLKKRRSEKVGCEQANDKVPRRDSIKVESKARKASANTPKLKNKKDKRMRKETGINGISLSLVVFELFFPAQFRNKAQRGHRNDCEKK